MDRMTLDRMASELDEQLERDRAELRAAMDEAVAHVEQTATAALEAERERHRNARTVVVRLLAETVTDDDGQAVDGSHGLMTLDGDYVPMDGVCGPAAREVLDAHGERLSIRQARDLVESYGPADSIDDRGGEAIRYRADLPSIALDVPYVRAIAVEGHPRAVRAVMSA